MCMAAQHRSEHDATAAELWRAQAALASPAGSLLPVWLFGGAGDVADALGLVGAGAPFRQLPIHHTRKDVLTRCDAEHAVTEVDLTDRLVVESNDRTLHGLLVLQLSATA